MSHNLLQFVLITVPVVNRPSLAAIITERGFTGALFIIGEVLFITRPLLYVLLIRRYGTRSWTPWFLSLGVDLLGLGFLSYVKERERTEEGKRFCLSAPESDEVVIFLSILNCNFF